jgi:lipopolysaccharide export system permease protein
MLDGRPILMTYHDNPTWLKPNEAYVVSDVTIDELMGGQMLRRFASTGELIWALKNRSIFFSPDVRVMIHSRIVQPVLDITLLFLGLPLVVARDNRNVFVAIGMCMGLVALFFIVSIACQQLGSNMLISPSMAAWAPLMIFVPAAVGMAGAMWEK